MKEHVRPWKDVWVGTRVLCVDSFIFAWSCLVLPCLALPWLALPCLDLPCLVLPCLALPCLGNPTLLYDPVLIDHMDGYPLSSSYSNFNNDLPPYSAINNESNPFEPPPSYPSPSRTRPQNEEETWSTIPNQVMVRLIRYIRSVQVLTQTNRHWNSLASYVYDQEWWPCDQHVFNSDLTF